MIPLGPREMPEGRAASAVVVTALIRAVSAEGGSAMVLERGDQVAGAILLLFVDRGIPTALRERVWRIEGGYRLESVGPEPADGPSAIDAYIARRRKSDPDLWVLELDHPKAEAITAAMLS